MKLRLVLGVFIGLLLIGAIALLASGPALQLYAAAEQDQAVPGEFDSGEGCAEGPEGSIPMINQDHGYCLRYLEGFTEEYPSATMAALIGQTPLQEPNHSQLYIEVTPAEGRSADEVADAIVADVASALPGHEVARTPITLSGEPAVLLENMPGQEFSRQIIAVHGDRLYKLTFAPWNNDGSRIAEQLGELYGIVLETFEFHG